MARVLFDRVMETAATTGTGTFTLAGAVTGYVTFTSVLSNADTVYYGIWNQSVLGEWEVGLGTFTTSGTTLARTTPLASSNGGAAVNFSAGTKNVWGDAPAVVLRKILQTFTSGSVLFVDSSGNFAEDNAGFSWDDTNNRLAVANSTGSAISANGNTNGTVQAAVVNSSAGASAASLFYAQTGTANTNYSLGLYDAAGAPFVSDAMGSAVLGRYYNSPFHSIRSSSGAVQFSYADTSGVRVGPTVGASTSLLMVEGAISTPDLIITGDLTVTNAHSLIINNKAGSTCTLTLVAANTCDGREYDVLNYQAQTIVSASANIRQKDGASTSTAIAPATAGAWVTIKADSANNLWRIIRSGT